MNDIVERLRDTNGPDAMLMGYQLRLEAADEIERLRAQFEAERKQLDAALQAMEGEADESASIIAHLRTVAEAKLATAVKALEPFVREKLPNNRRTEIGFDRHGLRRIISPFELAQVAAIAALKEIGDSDD